MIISRTPLRVSFAGGGTDIPDYYRTGYGAVTSATIRKYMYVTVNRRFDKDLRVSYSKTEIVDHIDKLEHGIVRELLKAMDSTSRVRPEPSECENGIGTCPQMVAGSWTGSTS